jgi:hypothetical protein
MVTTSGTCVFSPATAWVQAASASVNPAAALNVESKRAGRAQARFATPAAFGTYVMIALPGAQIRLFRAGAPLGRRGKMQAPHHQPDSPIFPCVLKAEFVYGTGVNFWIRFPESTSPV